MVPPEPSGHTTGKCKYPNRGDAEEIDFKCNFMRMMKTFKEEVKNSLTEMAKNTNKNWMISRNILKEPKKTHSNSQTGEANISSSSILMRH